MQSDYYSELVGDKFVHHLQVDFMNRQTILILGGHPHDEMICRYTFTFNGSGVAGSARYAAS